MSAPHRILSDLLSQIDCDAFFRDYWERQSLHVRDRDPQRYQGLLTRGDVDHILTYTRPRFADPGAFENAAPSRSTYIRGVLAGQPAALPFDPGLADLRDAYDHGKSVVIMSMHHRWPAIATLCRGLEADFHCPVHANLYLTPADSQGFAAHYDPHEVLALQLEGVKTWRLYDHVEPFPMPETMRMPAGSLGKPREVCLRPGDLLYIPRGHVHDASTDDQSSMHLTVGINVYRWADLLHHAVAIATRHDVRFRDSIPGGALPTDFALLKSQFRQLLETLAAGPKIEALCEQSLHALGTQFFGELKMLPGNQFSAPESIPLTADTILERSPLTICRVVESEQGVAIEFPGNRVTGPRRIGSTLRFIARTSRFTVRDLPDDLNADSKMTLMQRLLHEGLLTIAPPTARGTPVRIDSSRTDDIAAAQGVLTDDTPHTAVHGLQPAVAAPR